VIKKLLPILALVLITACSTTTATPTVSVPLTVAPVGTADSVTATAPAVATQTDANTPTESAPTAEPTAEAATAVPAVAAPDPNCCQLTPVIEGLTRPDLVTNAGDDRLFILQQRGLISVFADGQLQTFLDLTNLLTSKGNEQGLLGLAFHPDYANNGLFYVNYTNTDGDTVVARYKVSSDNPNAADPNSAQILFTVDQPYANHNGGNLVFGAGDLLYIGMGDGGDQGDPHGNGQNPDARLGKMLRLHVDANDPQPEIWAMGLRNPWRFSFDSVTGDLFIGDVGQNKWEEIDQVASADLDQAGPNFGWNILEGTHRYATTGDPAGLTGPIAEYAHGDDGCSVTGGYVYRGAALPALQGNYFFADYCSGKIWSLTPNANGQWDEALFMDTDLGISSFGLDKDGELYVADLNGGAIYKLVGK